MARGRGGIGRGGRRGPSMFTIERSMKPPSDAHGYYFGWNGTSYTSEEYRPEFSDGRVSESDVHNLLQDLNSSRFNSPTFCPWELLFIPIVLGCIGGSIAILASNMVQTKTSVIRGTSTTGTIPETSAIAGMVVMGVLGLATIISICCFATTRARKYIFARAYHNQKIMEKHKTEVFGPKECNVRMSPHGSYIAIEFSWKPRPVMAVVPQGYALVPTGGAGAVFPGAGMNVYQPAQMAPAGYGAGPTMYNQPPPSFS